jgi:hypothetical protein
MPVAMPVNMPAVAPSEPAVDERPVSPQIEIPSGLRVVAIDGLEQMKDGYERVVERTGEAEAVLEKSCATAMQGSAELGLKMVAILQENINAGFDFATEMAEARTLPDMIELASRFTARQLEVSVAQGKELWSAGQRLMSDTARPLAAGFSENVDRGAAT